MSRSGWFVVGCVLLVCAVGIAAIAEPIGDTEGFSSAQFYLLAAACAAGGVISQVFAWRGLWRPASRMPAQGEVDSWGDFDLFRLTFAGWLLGLLTVGVVGAVYWLAYTQTWIPLTESKRMDRVVGVVALPAAMAFLFAGRAVLKKLGIALVWQDDREANVCASDDSVASDANRVEGSSGAGLNAWTCSSCREQIDGSFEVCWNCGTAVDGTPDPTFRRDDEQNGG